MKVKTFSLIIFSLMHLGCFHKEGYVDVHGVQLRIFEFGKVPFPTENDRQLAKKLPKDIVENVSAFLHSHNIVEPEAGLIVAARYHENYLLLDVTTSIQWSDSNMFFVYSVPEDKVVGLFSWYAQG